MDLRDLACETESALSEGEMMIGVYMQGPSMTAEQYNDVKDRLIKAFGDSVDGLMLHTCFREGEGLAVFDVWESQEAFAALGSKLTPILEEVGAEMSPPQFVEMIAFDLP
jgi:hypothetical protein